MRNDRTPPNSSRSTAEQTAMGADEMRSRFGRRSLLKRAAIGACVGATMSGVSLTSVLSGTRSAYGAPGRRFLVLLRLYGGNDGLNTVIPYQDARYYDQRPLIHVPGAEVLPLNQRIGFHPAMNELHAHFSAGRVAVIQSVGYAPPNLSHFRSEVIWQSADPVTINSTGWIGRYLDTLAPPGDPKVRAVDVSYDLDHVFLSDHANVFASPSIDSFYFPTDYFGVYTDNDQKRALFERLHQEPRTPGSPGDVMATAGFVLSRNVDLYSAIADLPTEAQGGITFPDSNTGRAFRETARLIASARRDDIQSGVFQVGVGGFDTHGEQNDGGGHPDLWREISTSLDAFYRHLQLNGIENEVVVLVYSEFGRRVEENGSEGTDHGTAAPMLVFGAPVIGGIYGPDPNLNQLDDDGNLRFDQDFRTVYATILERWLGADQQQVLGATFTPVPFL